MRWRVKEDKDRKIERQKTERRKIRDAESSEAMRRTPRGSEKRMKRKKRGAETSDAMRRATRGSKNSEEEKREKEKRRREPGNDAGNIEETQKKSEES